MKNISIRHKLCFLGCLFLLSACGGGTPDRSGLTPFPDQNDISDEKLEEAVTTYLQQRGAPPNSEYDFVRTDLNNDGKRDGLVLFKLPHTYWCGWDGCGMAVFRAGSSEFSLVANIGNIRGPLYVSDQTNKGWRDIIIRVSGTKMRDKNIKLQYNGTTYPHSPLLAPTLHRPLSSLQTETFFR